MEFFDYPRAVLLFSLLIKWSVELSSAIYTFESVTSVREEYLREPSVMLAIIARNEEHTLPIYLAGIERLDYPKKRMHLFIQTDHNEDNTKGVLEEWILNVQHMYHRITIRDTSNETYYPDAKGPNDWSPLRYSEIMKLRQSALEKARDSWADYLFFSDCDNFITNPMTLKRLIQQNKTVVAPVMTVFSKDGGYSNFWCGMDEHGYYKRTPDYFPILTRKKLGCFAVPMVHSTYLIDLRRNFTDALQYYPPHPSYQGEWDDILVFAHSAKIAGISLHILNEEVYGQMMDPVSAETTLEEEKQILRDNKLEYAAYNKPLAYSRFVTIEKLPIDNLGFEEVYLINLPRRPERRSKMLYSLAELGLSPYIVDAVDGRQLTKKKLEEYGIKPVMDFKDPFLQRPLTMGEVGCFLSHWNIWQEMVRSNIQFALVLEDDVRFMPDFKEKLRSLVLEASKLREDVDWDLIYLGRKHMDRAEEHYVLNSNQLVWAKYSYWTLGYILRVSGAKKLLAGKPLDKLIPVDEYIPIMFDQHPDARLKALFSPRNLLALSAEPLLIFPTHYVGDDGYISDTEETLTIFEKPPDTHLAGDADKLLEKATPKTDANTMQIQSREEL